jgi:hypothetical protein
VLDLGLEVKRTIEDRVRRFQYSHDFHPSSSQSALQQCIIEQFAILLPGSGEDGSCRCKVTSTLRSGKLT